MTLLKVDDLVRVHSKKYPGTWKVLKVNPTTYKLTSLNAPGQGTLRAAHSLVTQVAGTAETVPLGPVFLTGMVVRTSARRLPGLWVVTKVNAVKVHIAPLGGGRGWHIVPTALTEVPLETLGDALWTEQLNAS